MTRQETLDILNKLNDKLNGMTDEELYKHMVETSPSFRKTLKDLDDFCKEEDIRELIKYYSPASWKKKKGVRILTDELYEKFMKYLTEQNKKYNNFELVEEINMDNEIFDEYGNYKFNWVPKHTPTDVSATGGATPKYGIDWLHHDSRTSDKSTSETHNMSIDLGIIDGDKVKPTPKMEDLKSNFHNPFKPEGNWTADNKTDKVNLDAIDNKTSPGPRGKEKITPIEIKIAPLTEDDEDDHEDETDVGKKDEKFSNIYINGDIYHKITEALHDYISLIHSDLCRLASYHYSNSKEVLELAEKLVEAEDTLNLVRDTFRPNRAPVVLDEVHNDDIAYMEGDPKDFAYPNTVVLNMKNPDFITEKLEKVLQTPEVISKILNGITATNVVRKDIMAGEKKEDKK